MRRVVLLFLALPALAQDFDHFLQTYTAGHNFMGTVLVARGNQVLFSRGYGFANLEWRISNDPATKFRIGSITKQFTAAAILLLEERGRLNIDDPVKKHLPNAPAAWSKITLRHLLTHTSGIPELLDTPEFVEMQARAITPEELIARFRDLPLDFEPGSQFRYSNSGYMLLSYLIERITGESYEQFLRESFFGPLEMSDSGYDSNSAIIPHRATGYAYTTSGFENAAFIHMSIPQGAGGLYSSTGDLFKWTQALFAGKILKPESVAKMTTPYLDNYALGLFVETAGRRKAIRHSGAIDGFDTDLAYYPDDQLTVVVLSNVEADGPDAEELGSELAALVHGNAKRPSGGVFSGVMQRVGQGSLTIRLGDGVLIDAAFPASTDLSASSIAARYHIADQVRIECAHTKTVYDSAALLHLHLALKSIELERAATSREQAREWAALSWRQGENLLKLPERITAISPASSQAAMADIERVRKINLDRLSKMPDFIADEIQRRFRSEGPGQPWKLADTIESEVSVKDDAISHVNIRRNAAPLKQPLSKYPGLVWSGDFGTMLGTLDPDCSFTFSFAGVAMAGTQQLRAYRFSAPPGGCFHTDTGGPRGEKNHREYRPAGAGRILVDSRGAILRFEYEGSGFPEPYPADRIASTTAWDYVSIGGSSYLVPVATTFTLLGANGSGRSTLIEYHNHRHFEASTNVTYNPGK